MMNINRIMICGRPGSGKSTFAKKLSKRLGLPLYHLDKIFFVENWAKQDNDVFLQQQQDIVDQDQWIIDGNSSQSFGMRYGRGDLVIYFNASLYLCLWRIIKRRFVKDPSIDDRAPHCPERISWNLIKYTLHYERRAAHRLALLMEQYPDVPFVVVKSSKHSHKLCETLTA